VVCRPLHRLRRYGDYQAPDKASGKLARRPELDKALLVLREGDQLVITKLDRLGHSLAHLIDIAADLQKRGMILGG
jgi:DNA invertase Pin-like site-specific DNA recombinase